MLIVLLTLLSVAWSLSPEQCERSYGDEVEYLCGLNNATVALRVKTNDYVNVHCEGPNITCSHIPHFDIAGGLTLKSIGLTSCPSIILSCVNDHIAASSLEIVTLRNMSGVMTREQLQKLGDVRVLMVEEASSETSFPTAVVTTFPNLRHLSFGGGNFQLSPNVFQNSPPIQHLELYKDNITSIPPDSFVGLESLTDLNFWQNPIQSINAGAFKGLDSLEMLTLTSNNLTSIEVGTFSDVPKLKSLYMMANRIETMPNGLLQGLEQLENITIQMNRVPLTLDTTAFSNLPSLQNIIIKYTTLRPLSAGLFNTSNNIQTIQWNYDQIESLPSEIFLRLSELRRLDLSYNKINILPKGIFRGLGQLEYLNMNRNAIEVLPEGLFDGTRNLKEIHIDFNKISTIGLSSFSGARNLHTLSLSTNQLTLDTANPAYSFIDDYADDNSLSPFNSLVNLVKLDLSHNMIRTIFYDWQVTLLQLEVLDLTYNHFKVMEFDNRAINFLNTKLTVDLRFNKIPTIILDKPISPLNTSHPTATLLLDNNPLSCDCAMYGLRIRLNGTKYAQNEPKFDLSNARCSSPPQLQGELFTELDPKRLVCDLPEYLPKSCSSCVANVALNELEFTCKGVPKLPDTKQPNISYYFIGEPTITLNLLKQPESLKGLNVHTLNLSHTGIESIKFGPTESLKVLDLSGNFLSTVPIEFLTGNITLYLAGNPIECECWYADDISALQKYGLIADFDQMICANGDKIALIDAASLCNTWKASIAAIGTFVTLGICCLIAALVIYRYSNEILVYMTTRGICKCCVKEVLLDKDKEFDLFLSFAHQDLELVQDKLMPTLENEFNQKVCVHYRDWIVGDMIPTQILRSVESSRRTVIILSKNFLDSIWANLEFCAAHNLALQEGKSRVILIVLEENITKHANLSEEVRAYIATNTYLLWEDPKFWEKLRKVLPRKRHTFTWLDALRQRSEGDKDIEKEGVRGLDVQLNAEGKLVNVAKKVVSEAKGLPHHFV